MGRKAGESVRLGTEPLGEGRKVGAGGRAGRGGASPGDWWNSSEHLVFQDSLVLGGLKHKLETRKKVPGHVICDQSS